MKIKLHWKLTVIFCSAVMAGLLIGYFYLTSHLTERFDHDLKTGLSYRLLLGKNFLESQINSRDMFSDPAALANKIGQEQDLRVTIIALDGTVIGDSYLNPLQIKNLDNHLHRPEIQEALIKGLGTSTRYSRTLNRYLLYMAVVIGKSRPFGFLRYAVPVSYIDILKSSQEKIIIGALLLVFVLSIGFTFVISLVVTRPLIEMADVAQNMAKGNFSRKPYRYTKDEIGDMAEALAYMSEEIKEKIDKIQRERIQLDAVLSSMFEGIMVVDDKSRIVLMNLSLKKLFFIDFDPEKKASIEAIRIPQIHDIVDGIMKKKQRLISEEVDITQPEEKILRINAVPIMRNSVLTGAVLVFHDVTEIRRLERIQRDFVANVSHELRTPVTNIKGYTETLLQGGLEDKERAKEFIYIINENSNRLENLIDDLLDLAVIESNKMKMNFSPIEIRPVIDRCLGVLEKSIKDKHLRISVNIPDRLPKIMADDKRLTQVFLNLLDNAVKYTPDAGSIKIDISTQNNLTRIDVSDTGPGIPENDLPRIFERFYRVDKSRSRALGGTGLGLSIVKHIVVSHKGQIWINSTKGQGTTVSFTIPQVA